MEMSDYRFESFVVELLQAMGYGGADSSSGEVTGQTADGGIDGIIHGDKLGFDSIYIQAKHWDPVRTVTRPDIQGFAGALAGYGANKGLFITTARFSEGARDYARKLSTAKTKIVLVDGQQLAQLMIEYDFGVTVRKTYELKTIDRDFFDEDA